MLLVGLSGGIACGKTTVANFLREFQIEIIDVDEIAKEISLPYTDTYFKIVKSFGKDILNRDNSINRDKLGEIIFSDPNKRKLLDKITHPKILSIVREKVNKLKDEEIVVIDIPLLFEVGFEEEVDKILVVVAKRENQIERLIKKYKIDIEEAEKRINSQFPISLKIKKADWVIHNNGSLEDLKKKVKKVYQEMLKIRR